MAGYNELMVGRYNRFIQKLLSMKGRATLESLNPELHAVLLTFHGVENRYLEGWDRFGAAKGVGAQGVGNLSVMEVRNPAGSNVVACVESIIGSTNGAAAAQMVVSYAVLGTDNASTSNGFALDSRSRQLSSLIVSVGSTSVPNDILTVATGINVPWQFISDESQEIPVLPGFAIGIRSSVTNQAANFTMVWRERFLEESERT